MFILVDVMVVLSVLCAVTSEGPPISPCPSIYHYESDGESWFGVIEASNPPPYGSAMALEVKMEIETQLPSDYVGKLELADDRTTVLKSIGQNWPIKYKVHFPVPDPIPHIVYIKFDNRIICTGPALKGGIRTIMNLAHTLHSGESALRNSPKDKLVYSEPIPVIPRDIIFYETEDLPFRGVPVAVDNRASFPDGGQSVKFNPIPPKPQSNNTLLNNHGICGSTKTVNPLIVSESKAAKGEWPWLVAIFIKKPRGLSFICAGTLISDRLVVTAGHCVKGSSKNALKPADIVLRLGVYNLQDWTEETAVTKGVSKIRIHEDFNKEMNLLDDIAVLILKQLVSFTEYIRPVCLWSGNPTLNRVVGLSGTVVGWGRDNTGPAISPELKNAAVPIVSNTECKASRSEFHRLTWEKTLCAGGRDGTGPCNGDSGGGLYLKKRGKWVLRGIVSNSLRDPETNGCNLNEYVIYTDAAKYFNWIAATV